MKILHTQLFFIQPIEKTCSVDCKLRNLFQFFKISFIHLRYAQTNGIRTHISAVASLVWIHLFLINIVFFLFPNCMAAVWPFPSEQNGDPLKPLICFVYLLLLLFVLYQFLSPSRLLSHCRDGFILPPIRFVVVVVVVVVFPHSSKTPLSHHHRGKDALNCFSCCYSWYAFD